MVKFVEKVKKDKVLRWIYSQEQDFNNGRGFFGKLTSLTGEFSLAILVATFFFGVDLSKNIPLAVKWVTVALLFIYLFGKFYRRLGLLEVDQRATANRSPVNKIILEAAEIIIKEKRDEEN